MCGTMEKTCSTFNISELTFYIIKVEIVGREDELGTNIVIFPNSLFSIHDIITNNNLIKKTCLRKTCCGDWCLAKKSIEFNKLLVRIMS